ncbi:sporulation protein YpjB [Paenibacillus cellulosilyticus]|uniref:Sporulation protein YpjB n=1 Tax=Paenibacillus cellulosilyticus TaxID=375489 RepID=A0A2V2YWQ9_9BACL|nr:sporulation protein YpjB [Paenibacillus cellulosilyticus]PWW05525.1 sporulation protein YpjB [Paenibacillus cellulosilyticus]QKS45438.1 hypothetical protein HUB94_14155 [Paenibacillus cellulosilyticus]
MRKRWLVACMLCIVLTALLIGAAATAAPTELTASSNSKSTSWQRVQRSADAIYEAATEGNRQTAYFAGQQLSSQLQELLTADSSNTVNQWRGIYQESKLMLGNIEQGKSAVLWRPQAIRIKLAVDAAGAAAVGVPSNAMWLQYDPIIKEDIARIKQAINMRNAQAYASAGAMLHTLQEHVDRIAIAATIANKTAEMNALQNSVTYMSRLLEAGERGSIATQLSQQVLAPVEAASAALFGSNHEREQPVIAPIGGGVPHRWIFGISSLISSLLAYVSWRKYKHSPYAILKKGDASNQQPLYLKRKIK